MNALTDLFDALQNRSATDMTYLMLYVGAFALLCIFMAACGFYLSRDRSILRMRSLSATAAPASQLTRAQDRTPKGWKKALIPEDAAQRVQVQFQLAKVGFDHAAAVEIFFTLRLILALATPLLVGLALFLANAGLLPAGLADQVQATTRMRLFQIVAVGAAVGFYGPGYWLAARIKAHQTKIRNSFPNALDLLQISVESGLGFDAALIRVGDALEHVAPEVSHEFRLLRQEIQAGADREKAMFAMADRMGIPEAKSFVLVIAQSMRFGTSLTSALRNFAIEMRVNRELLAQEKANKLPVQMSAVMSFLMLPSLFLITLFPVIIRYMAMY